MMARWDLPYALVEGTERRGEAVDQDLWFKQEFIQDLIELYNTV